MMFATLHAAHLDGSTLQNFAETLANDQIFARLQHPHADDNGIFPSGKPCACRAATGGRIDFDARLALAHFLHDFAAGSLDTRRDRKSTRLNSSHLVISY